jgi:uncharacterized membrane protein YraQ (UPF0718 family)
MNWETILASVTASSVIAAAIGYLIKKSFDKTMDLYFERIKEENKAVIAENVRRKAFLYDKRYEPMTQLSTLTKNMVMYQPYGQISENHTRR